MAVRATANPHDPQLSAQAHAAWDVATIRSQSTRGATVKWLVPTVDLHNAPAYAEINASLATDKWPAAMMADGPFERDLVRREDSLENHFYRRRCFVVCCRARARPAARRHSDDDAGQLLRPDELHRWHWADGRPDRRRQRQLLRHDRGGGISSTCCGTVFEIKKTATGYASTPTTLVSFNGTDGVGPYAGLIADANGNLFGTTYDGGASGACGFLSGCGTVFEVKKTADGYASAPTTLVSFNGTNGAFPNAGLIADANGNLFGTTSGGGTGPSCNENTNGIQGCGTVFEIKTDSTPRPAMPAPPPFCTASAPSPIARTARSPSAA